MQKVILEKMFPLLLNFHKYLKYLHYMIIIYEKRKLYGYYISLNMVAYFYIFFNK